MLYILTPIFCVALCVGAVFSFSLFNNKVTANAAVKSNAAYLDLNGTGKVLNGFEGGQKEFIYLGKYNNNLIKWRVLAVKDTKYGTGNNLLVFSDSTLGTSAVNTTVNSGASSSGTGGKYSFYGTSKLRAVLNGGYHLNTAGNSMTVSKVTDSDAYINKLFDGINQNLIMTANDFVTHDCINPNTTNTFIYKTVGDIFSNSDVKGKFFAAAVGAQPVNTKTGQNEGANNNFDITFSTSTGITETIKGDKLFTLDYEDMINRNYGFVNSSNQTYIEALGGNYATNYANQGYTYGYPSQIDTISPVFNNGNGFNSSDGKIYWLRNTARNTSNNNATSLYVNKGTIYQVSVDTNHYIRPAMVLDANEIAYATATAPTSGGFQSLTTSPATPEYKLYLKNTRFDDYSKDAKGNIKEDGGTLHITYNNPTGISGGNLLVLLTKQTDNDGAVDYQAIIPMSGNATASKNAVTSISLPSGVTLSTHSVTMMYTSAGPGNVSEEIYCSYPTSSGIDVPLDISGDNIVYDGNSKWIDSLGSYTPEWVDISIHNNATYMTVSEVVYTDSFGNITTDSTGSTTNIVNAGTYKFKMHLASGLMWSTGDNDDKYFSITINKKKSEPKPKVDPPITTTPFVSAGLPNLIADTGSTAGTFAWDTGEVATAGTKEYNWTFTPAELNNFTVEKGKMELEFLAREMNGIAVTAYNPTAPVYTSTSLATIKSYLTVEASYTDGKTEPLTTFKLEVDATDGKLKAGNNTLVITTNDDSQTISYEITGVIDVAVDTINVVQLKNNTFTYPVTADEIKAAISRVNVKWNTGSSGNLESFDDVTVTGTFNAGASVTVTIGVSGTTATKDITIVINKGTYEMSGITFGGLTLTYDGSSHKIEISGTLPEGVSVVYSVAGQSATEFTDAGTYEYTASFTHSNPNYNDITITKTATLKIEQADYPDADKIKFENKTVTHTGGAQSIEVTDVPTGVTVTYVYNGTEQSTPFEFTDLNESGYEVTAKFEHNNSNYKAISNKTAKLIISAKPTYNEEGLAFEATGAEGSGNSFTATYAPTVTVEIVLTGSVVDKDGAEVSVTPDYGYFKKVNGEWTECTAADLKGAGEYKIVVGISTGDESYAAIADREVTLTIAKAEYDIPENAFVNKTVAYTGEAFDPEGWIDTSALPEGVTVTYTCDGDLTAVGNYLVTAHFTGDGDNYEAIPDRTATLTISTAALVLEVEFEDSSVPYDGENHTITVTGTLPDGVTVAYFVGETPFTGATETGKYVVTAKFTVDLTIYNQPEDMTAELEITAVAYDMTGVTFENGAFVYDGEAHSIFVGGAALPEWITVEYEGNEVTEVGAHTVTAKFVSTNSNYLPIADMTAEIVISKAKVAAPVFKGGLSYTGNNITLTAENFNGYDAEIMTLVETETTPLKAKNAGDYTAIFVLLDPDRYEWNTVSAAGKKVFAAVVYEGKSAETAVKWSISKAVLTATQAEGELPVFASESYAGAISDVVTFRYFTDAECAQEVAADKLERLHDYYVVAEIADEVKDNFELELSASKFTKPFSYTTPEGELTFWEKVVKFMTAERMGLVVWLWIVIAVVALILLITIIALAAKSKKKKRIREEQRLAEEKAERLAREERDREERRLEREERMARMSQQQAMPQYIPQPMPQYMPQTQPQSQTVQPVMGGNGGTISEAQFMQMQAELAALKAEQSAKEMAMRAEMTAREAAMKAEQVAMKAEQNAVLRSDVNALRSGEQVGGISVDAMTEIMTAALKNVLSSATQQAIAGQNAQPAQLTDGAAPATPQVPPDAVMTTVTTTKIDTTKKAQGTHDTAQAARPTRSFVPPMPVDDGRVFDVGGFYKPADPVDLVDDEDNK